VAAQNWIWAPTLKQASATNVYRFIQKLGLSNLDEFLLYSRSYPGDFWDAMVQETGIEWSEPYRQVLDTSKGVEWARWFVGGKLNIAHNCVDRYRTTEKAAILWEGENGRAREVSFPELHRDVCRLANCMKSRGLAAGDRVALCMPMAPEVVTILYACFKLGLIAVPIFAGFGAGAIATRLEDSAPRLIFTGNHLERRGKRLPLEQKVRDAAEKAGCAAEIVVYSYENGWGALLEGEREECESLALDSEAPAMILYTSGTTGKPKGAVHTHAGALAQTAKEIYLGFDHQPDDRFFWLSDIGWMMGPWSIIGNHNFGGTIFMYDGAPDFPGPDRMWQLLDRQAITTFGISPTAIRLLMRDSAPWRYGMRSLRLLGSTGEPWDEPSYMWFFEQVGRRRCPILNISGGTEIIGCFLMPMPIQPLKPCTLGGPAPGIATEVVDEAGKPVRGEMGYLVCTKPAPSMTRGIWGDPDRYIETYWLRWPGFWYHGDWASVDDDGCWYLHGRADESMNVAGRKVGPAEVEEALMEHPSVSEAAVVGVPDELKGEAIVAFVVLRQPATTDELCAHVVRSMGPTFRPKAIHAVAELPKTQSGKIVRRLIRRKYLGEPLGDTSTVQNPGSLEGFGGS
jgi:acetyl-CoA synthetase